MFPFHQSFNAKTEKKNANSLETGSITKPNVEMKKQQQSVFFN